MPLSDRDGMDLNPIWILFTLIFSLLGAVHVKTKT